MFGQGSTRIRTPDFFGVVLPGFYTVLLLTVFTVTFPWGANCNEHTNVGKILDLIFQKYHWAPLVLILLFISYLIGSAFRARRMRVTDVFCYDLFHALREEEERRACEKTMHFPYIESLRSAKRAIFQAIPKHVRSDMDYEEDIPPYGLAWKRGNDNGPWVQGHKSDWWEGEPIFGFWKARLCNCENSAVFNFAQAVEARTRFFSGIMWAARWNLMLMFLIATTLVFRNFLVQELQTHFLPILTGVALTIWMILLLAEKGFQLIDGDLRHRDEIRTCSRIRIWRTLLILRLFLEAIGTVSLFWISARLCMLEWRLSQMALVGTLVTTSGLLFWFLGKRLRNVRNGEMRAVYLNYSAMVLAKKIPSV